MYPVQEIDDVTLAFPANVLHLMPKMEDIPEEFFRKSKWSELFNHWFYLGLTKLELTPKDGIDKDKALRHIKAIMGSYEPKHEHKMAAVAFLLSQWFTDPKWEAKSQRNWT